MRDSFLRLLGMESRGRGFIKTNCSISLVCMELAWLFVPECRAGIGCPASSHRCPTGLEGAWITQEGEHRNLLDFFPTEEHGGD